MLQEVGEESRDIDGGERGLGTLRWKTLQIGIRVRGWGVQGGDREVRDWRGYDGGEGIRLLREGTMGWG